MSRSRPAPEVLRRALSHTAVDGLRRGVDVAAVRRCCRSRWPRPRSCSGVVEGLASAADGVARLGGGALSEDPRRRRLDQRRQLRGDDRAHRADRARHLERAGRGAAGRDVGGARAALAAALRRRAGAGRPPGTDAPSASNAACTTSPSVGGPLLAFAALALFGVRAALLVAVVPGVVAAVIGFACCCAGPPAAGRPRARPRLRVRAVYRGRLGRLMTGITLFEAGQLRRGAADPAGHQAAGAAQDVPFGAAAMAVLLYLLWRLAAAGAARCRRPGRRPVRPGAGDGGRGGARCSAPTPDSRSCPAPCPQLGRLLPAGRGGQRRDRGGRARRRGPVRAGGPALVGVRVAVRGAQLRSAHRHRRRDGGVDRCSAPSAVSCWPRRSCWPPSG